MWQVLLAAAVAGSTGFVANHFLTQIKQCDHSHDDTELTFEDPISHPPVATNGCSGSELETNSDTQDGIFRFSSSESLRQHGLRSRASDSRKKPLFRRQRSKDGVKIAKMEQRSHVQARSEQSKDGKRLSFCLKRRKTIKNLAGKTGFCSSKGMTTLSLVKDFFTSWQTLWSVYRDVTYQCCLFMLSYRGNLLGIFSLSFKI